MSEITKFKRTYDKIFDDLFFSDEFKDFCVKKLKHYPVGLTIDTIDKGKEKFFVVCCKEYGYDFSGQRVIGDYVVTNQNVEDKYIAACCEYVQLKKPELIDLIFAKNSQYKNERSKYGNH